MHLNINLDWLSAKGLPILGLDISTTAIKLVELSDAGKGMLRVERYVIEPLPKDAVTDGNIANLDQVADALRTAWKNLGTRIKNVALALPSSAVITKKILVPASLTGLDLENQVETEANQVIPFSLDEVNLDFFFFQLGSAVPGTGLPDNKPSTRSRFSGLMNSEVGDCKDLTGEEETNPVFLKYSLRKISLFFSAPGPRSHYLR